MPDQSFCLQKVMFTEERWMLSETGEAFFNLQRPLVVLIDGKGTKTITTTGDIRLTALEYENSQEIVMDLDTFTGIPVEITGTQGTVKIID